MSTPYFLPTRLRDSMRSFKLILPSILSGFRLVAALAFPFAPERTWFWLVGVAGVSDALDGWLARRWQATSWQGGLIDAIADKLFALAVLLVFLNKDKVHPLWLPIVLSRDLLVLFTALYIASRRLWGSFRRMSARASGKIATGGQFFLFLTVVLVPEMTIYGLLLASTCSLWAAFDYGRLFARELTTLERNNG